MKNLPEANPSFTRLDLSGIMGLEVNDFIWQLYVLALGHSPDNEGWGNYKYLLCSGATREAVAYMICTSKEFANRFQVAYLDQYKRAYWNYRLRQGFRRLPVVGFIWDIAAIPRRINRLDIEERIRHVDSQLIERQRFETFMTNLQSLQVRVDALNSENALLSGSFNSHLSLDKAFQAQVEILNAEIKAGFESLSSKISEFNSHSIELSKLVASVDANSANNAEILAALQVANQNIIHANVKLDETGILINNAASRNRPVIYGLSGGVTAVQTKNFIIGVPSEEWRLAVFLSIYGRFEFGSEDYFCSILKAEMNVVDVGANLGIYTLHALKAGCQVFAYEPTPRVYNILLDNIGINGFEPTGRANVYNLAVSNVEGKAKFAIYENRNGHNSFYANNNEDKMIEVKTVVLDDHLAKITHIDVVKIDVEGAEPLVLEGMKGIITKNPNIKILMEFAPVHLRRGGKDPLDFIGDIRAMGLDIRLIHEDSGEILEISDEALCAVYSANVLLMRSG